MQHAPSIRLIDQKRREIHDICRKLPVRRLAVFGSALRSHFDPQRSDLDFLVEFDPLPAGEYAIAYFGLLEALDRLFSRPVDLLERDAIRNPYMRREIEISQETLYAT